MLLVPRERLFPELLLFEEGDDRTRALTRARMARHPVLFGLFTILVGWGALTIVFFGWRAIVPKVLLQGLPYWGLRHVMGLSACLATVLLANWTWRRRIRRALREELQHCGVPICVRCGYDLRGQVEARCPECGEVFDSALLEPAPKATGERERDE
jgi:hypothetical protein